MGWNLPNLKFPFVRLPKDPASDPFKHHSILRPIIEVRLHGPNGFLRVWALVDTGADDTIFHNEIAERLGIDWEAGSVSKIGGFGGGWADVYFTKATYDIAGHKINSLVGFTDLSEEPTFRAVLGERSFFDHAIVIFNHSANRIEIRL